MSSTPDGGPAFPRPLSHLGNPSQEWSADQLGMSLRDWFAGQALIGLMPARISTQLSPEEFAGALATAAYRVADAFLKERTK